MNYSIKTRVKKLPADFYTPVGIYMNVRDLYVNTLLLESSDYYGKENHFSYICIKDYAGIEVSSNTLYFTFPDKGTRDHIAGSGDDLLQTVSSFIGSFSFDKTEKSCCEGRFFGHINYDAVRYFEDISISADGGIPDIRFHLYRFVFVFDHFHQTLYLTEHYLDEPDEEGMRQMEAILKLSQYRAYPFALSEKEFAYTSEETFLENVKKGIENCKKGDVFQLVLSRRFSIKYTGDEFNVYRALRIINPSPYLFFFDYGNYKLFGSSPEAQLKSDGDKTIVHPIAGTCPRTGNPETDNDLLRKLKEDQKENAEHVMLVDLARNDLSKSHDLVEVTKYKEIQQFSHVFHIVSEVSGKEPIHRNALKRISESFPAGTLSGAPKYKAMELINAYEAHPRGFYGGCIGFIQPGGIINQAILIRSFLCKDYTLTYQAGAGITVKSVPENELREIDHKLGGLRNAIRLAQTF